MKTYARCAPSIVLLISLAAAPAALAHPSHENYVNDCGSGHGHSEGGLVADLGSFLPSQVAEKDIVPATHYERGSWDNDGDGVRNDRNALPNDRRDTRDRDGDGVGDNVDHFPDDPEEWFDKDADGIGDSADTEWTGPARIYTVDSWMGDGVYGQSIGFDMIYDTDGHLTVVTRVKLNGPRNAQREAEWEQRAEEVWSTRDMTVDVQWVESGQHTSVTVSSGSGRANSRHFYTGSSSGTVAHEIGHHLGLLDEYYDSRDQARLLGESDSIMRNSGSSSSQAYPRHIAMIMSYYSASGSKPYAGEIPTGSRFEGEDRPWVECPDGTRKYLASGAAWRQSICKSTTENSYWGYHNGKWMKWVKHLPNDVLRFTDTETGEIYDVPATALPYTANPGEVPEGAERANLIEEAVVEEQEVEQTEAVTEVEEGEQTEAVTQPVTDQTDEQTGDGVAEVEEVEGPTTEEKLEAIQQTIAELEQNGGAVNADPNTLDKLIGFLQSLRGGETDGGDTDGDTSDGDTVEADGATGETTADTADGATTDADTGEAEGTTTDGATGEGEGEATTEGDDWRHQPRMIMTPSGPRQVDAPPGGWRNQGGRFGAGRFGGGGRFGDASGQPEASDPETTQVPGSAP